VTPPQSSRRTHTNLSIDDASRLGADVRVWPILMSLWAYSALSGGLAIGVGEAVASVTQTVLPAVPVRPIRLAAVVAAVVVAGLGAEAVLGGLNRLVRRHRV
jgi:hypothetical protein